jgi:predicted dehydrogenase
MSDRTTRRGFLQTTALTGVGCWVAGGIPKSSRADGYPAASPAPSKSPNSRIALASIGLGNQGSHDSGDAAPFGDMVAICDVDENVLNSVGQKRFPKAKRYTDFRKMLDEMGSSIDAVTVSTPDHNHAPAALMAMRMGKHCYCQKPLTHTIYEARLMAQVACENRVATQMGNQGTADDSLRKSAAVIKSGVLGTVKEVHVWTNRPIWPQGGRRPKSVACPAHLNWNLWLGPAAARPYANGYHPFSWRGWWDFGTGALGDIACHTVNLPYMALNLRDPVAVQAECPGHDGDGYPKWSIIKFDFPALDGRPAVKFTWYDGGKRPGKDVIGEMDSLFKSEIEKAHAKPHEFFHSGCAVVGEKYTLFAPGDYAEHRCALSGGAALPEVPWVKSPGHFEEWIRAIKGGEPAMSNFPDYAGGLTETILLGNLAVWTAATGKGPRVEWNAKNLKSTNIAGLDTIVKPIYRPGYTLDV